MKFFPLILAFAMSGALAAPLQPADIVIKTDPAVVVKVTRNKTNTSKQISITVNAQDVVTVNPIVVPPPVVVPPPPPQLASSWNEGATITVTGTQTVYYGSDIRWVSASVVGSAPCTNGFFGSDPAFGSVKTCTLTPPPPVVVVPPPPPMDMHSGIHVDTSKPWPAQPGVNTVMLTPPGDIPPLRNDPRDFDDGAFRTLCNFSKQSYDDPIVYPGQPGMAHHHTFYGNTGIDAFTTTDNIRTKGNASCRGGTVNMSGYWIPSLIDTVTSLPVEPGQMIVYYKTGFATFMVDHLTNPIRPLPHGLRMIVGNSKGTTPNEMVQIDCIDGNQSQVPGSLAHSISACAPGNWVRAHIDFPQCWDGKNLDSPDHKSHMAEPVGVPVENDRNLKCPDTHPVVIPHIGFIVTWFVPAGADTTKWRFASDGYDPSLPGGYSYHQDYFEGWDPALSDLWGQKCLVERRECGSFNLGDGRTSIGFQGN